MTKEAECERLRALIKTKLPKLTYRELVYYREECLNDDN